MIRRSTLRAIPAALLLVVATLAVATNVARGPVSSATPGIDPTQTTENEATPTAGATRSQAVSRKPSPSPTATSRPVMPSPGAPGPMRILLVVADKNNPSAADLILRRHLADRGKSVTLASDEDPDNADGYDLVIVFESVVGATLGTKYASLGVPLLGGEHTTWSAENLSRDSGHTDHDGRTTVEIFRPGNAVAAGYSGDVDLYSISNPSVDIAWADSSSLGPGAVGIARFPDLTSHWCLFMYDRGSIMANGSLAPARRLALDFSDEGVATFTPAAWALFDASIDWLLR